MGFDTTSAEILCWCRQHLGEPTTVLFEAAHLSRVVGLRLADGREVVVKVRPAVARLAACVRVQQHLAAAGFPCPRPLAGPDRLGPVTVTAEEYRPGGEGFDGPDQPERFAELFAELVALAPAADTLPTLEPAPPWVRPDHDQPGCWPEPDDLDLDLNAHPGPAWLDRLAARIRDLLAGPDRLTGLDRRPVVGHSDFEAQNTGWTGRSCHVVYDWDSVAARPEAVLVGAAAAVFTATGEPGTEATVAQTERFLDAYDQARARRRGRRLDRTDRRACWAAGLWVRAFNAKKAWVRGDRDTATRLAAELPERLHRTTHP